MPSLHAIIDTGGGFARYIRAIMRGDIKPGVVDERGRTALHTACLQNNRTLAKYLLLRHDIDAEARDVEGKTALQLTPQEGLPEMTILFSQMEARKQSRRRRRGGRRDRGKGSAHGVSSSSSSSNSRLARQKKTGDDKDNDSSSSSDSSSDSGAEEMVTEGDVRESETVSPGTLRRIVLCLVAPFCFLIVYNGFFFAVKFVAVSLTFYYLSVAYFVAEVAIRPPWYHHKPKATQLTMVGCPDYWQGWICDPKVDFDIDFVDVAFASTDGYTLRGWYVPATTTTAAATAAAKAAVTAAEAEAADTAAPSAAASWSSSATQQQQQQQHSAANATVRAAALASHKRYNSRESSRVAGAAATTAADNNNNSRSSSSSSCNGGNGAQHTSSSPLVPPLPQQLQQQRHVGLVLVHGGGRDRRTWLRHLPFLHEAGYACLLFDLREHGCSDGNMRGFTFGMRERYDVIAACQYMRRVSGCTRVCAMGTSVGGASVIMAAAIDKTIDIVIAENAITTSASLLDQQVVMYFGGYFAKHPYSLFFFKVFRRLCTFWLNVRIGNKPSRHCQALHCVDAVAPRPVLLMHGTSDTIVPCKHSQLLYERAKEPKQLYLCEGAYHCGLYNTQPEVFEDTVLGFLRRYGGGGGDGDGDDNDKSSNNATTSTMLDSSAGHSRAGDYKNSSSSAGAAADEDASVSSLSRASRGSASWRRAAAVAAATAAAQQQQQKQQRGAAQ